ncbi:hypothetical protein [Streptomyces sp. T028]|uniref:hypothetical protein n=1 Tax=Streptomyces sp. T028 TaxID=3394379 RepID=UPI003A849D57
MVNRRPVQAGADAGEPGPGTGLAVPTLDDLAQQYSNAGDDHFCDRRLLPIAW